MHKQDEPPLAAPTAAPRPLGAQPSVDGWAFLWRTTIRATDCDELGHLNNTRYAAMAEDAVGEALHSHAFASDPTAAALAAQPVVSCHIEYRNELLPYTEVTAAVGFDAAQCAFVVQLFGGNDSGEAVAKTEEGRHPTPPSAAVIVLGCGVVEVVEESGNTSRL